MSLARRRRGPPPRDPLTLGNLTRLHARKRHQRPPNSAILRRAGEPASQQAWRAAARLPPDVWTCSADIITIQFSSYELFKGVLTSADGSVDTPRRLLAGSLAGICSVVSTYPLDLVRSRLSVESASLGMREARTDGKSTGIVGMTLCVTTRKLSPVSVGSVVAAATDAIRAACRKVMREEGGVKALYRGLVATSAGKRLKFPTAKLRQRAMSLRGQTDLDWKCPQASHPTSPSISHRTSC